MTPEEECEDSDDGSQLQPVATSRRTKRARGEISEGIYGVRVGDEVELVDNDRATAVSHEDEDGRYVIRCNGSTVNSSIAGDSRVEDFLLLKKETARAFVSDHLYQHIQFVRRVEDCCPGSMFQKAVCTNIGLRTEEHDRFWSIGGKKICLQAINRKRQTICAAMKKAFRGMIKDGIEPPSPVDILGNLETNGDNYYRVFSPIRSNGETAQCLRSDRNGAYTTFCMHFIKCSSPHKTFSESHRNTVLSSFMPAALEAYTVIAYVNAYDAWLSQAMPEEEEDNSTTNNKSFRFTGKSRGAKRFEGWSPFGIDLYNKVHMELKQQRTQQLTGNDFEQNLMTSFFDTTPLGRILSRFSKDLYSIDLELSDMMDSFLGAILQVIASLGAIMYVTPWFGVAIIPLGYLYWRFLNYYREVSRETKRLENVSRSPVYAHFSETLSGLSTIRAYGEPNRFKVEFDAKINSNTRAYYNNKTAQRWLSARLETIGAIIAGITAFLATRVVISDAESGSSGDDNFSSLAGLSLTYSISVISLLQWCVRSFANLEAAMNSSERVLYYTENIPQEAPWTAKELEDKTSGSDPSTSDPSAFAVAASGGEAAKMDSNWPDKGAIVLNNLRMRYRSDTPLVLKGFDVSIAGGERVGVVGRTGSGKSSLLLALLRLVEPDLSDAEKYEAPMSIDGVDTLRIGLRDLRSKVAIIPQNPVLFSGTIRSNMDPFSQFQDEEIWKALEKCGLKESVEGMPGGLEAAVAEYGQNLSSGMRQMLVLGRALLKQCRVLLLDEATSSVDLETDREIQRTLREAFQETTVLTIAHRINTIMDREIQRTLREAFQETTVLTIAHRINTIMDSDKILVVKDGCVAEFAPPQELLKDETSLFSEIVSHTEAEDK